MWCLMLAAQVSPGAWCPDGGWARVCRPGAQGCFPLCSLPAVSTLEKTLPQLLAKLNLLQDRGAHNASLALSASIGRVRELIAQARGAASKVGASARATWASGRPGGGR